MFLSRLLLEAADDPDIWIVRAPLIWEDSEFGRIVVPIGFKTDLASIPRLFRNIPEFDPNGLSRRAAVGHDWFYAEQSRPKEMADRFLRSALIAEGVPHAAAEIYFLAVERGGGSGWAADTGHLAAHFDTDANYQRYLAGEGA